MRVNDRHCLSLHIEPAVTGQALCKFCYVYVTEEEAPDLDDDGNDLEDSETPGKKRKKERVKLNPQFMTGVSGAEAITDQPRLSDVQHKVQDMCEWKG